MAIVEKGNVVLDIKDSEIDRYLNLGYNVTDGKGNILQECMPRDIVTLQKAYMNHITRIKELEDEISKLKSSTKKSGRKAAESPTEN